MSFEDFFLITTENIWEEFNFSYRLSSPDFQYNLSPLERRCLLVLYRFLDFKGQVKGISEFREELGYKHGYEIQNERRDLARKGIYLGLSLKYKENPNEPIGVNVKQKISPQYEIAEERIYFNDLFPFRFIQIKAEYRDQFLSFHLNTTFKNDIKKYKKFLLDSVLGDSNSIVGSYADSLRFWIEDNLQVRRKRRTKSKSNDEPLNPKVREAIANHLFLGNYQSLKVKRLGEVAFAYSQKLYKEDQKYNASSFCRLLYHSFGEKLGIEKSTLIGYVKKSKMIENNSSKALFDKIYNIVI